MEQLEYIDPKICDDVVKTELKSAGIKAVSLNARFKGCVATNIIGLKGQFMFVRATNAWEVFYVGIVDMKKYVLEEDMKLCRKGVRSFYRIYSLGTLIKFSRAIDRWIRAPLRRPASVGDNFFKCLKRQLDFGPYLTE